MNISEADLEREITWAILHGWVSYYQHAAATYGMGVFDVADYMAITSRETNFNPKYLTVPGDNGHGYGPMQADGRSFGDWIKTGQWKKPDQAIIMGAKVLAGKYQDVRLHEGQRLEARDSHSGRVYVVAKAKVLTPNERYSVSLSAYNCGEWALYNISKGKPIDASSTGKNYSSDVVLRAIHIRTMLARHEASSLTTR